MIQFFKVHKKLSIAILVFFSLIIVHFSIIYVIPCSSLNSFLNRAYSVTIYDRNIALIQITAVENGTRREFTPLEQIPSELQKAFIKAEDNRFFEHGGVDFKAAIRAFKQNTTELKTVSGASTITMQLARIICPSSKRNIFAKIKDVYNAWRIEARLSKDKILELYLNSIPFGNNVEGVTSAARFYLKKELNELTYSEIYCLAVIPRNPTLYNPILNPENCAIAASSICEKTKDEIFYDINGLEPFEWPFFMPQFVDFLKGMYKDEFGRSIHKLNTSADLFLHDFALFKFFENRRKIENSRIDNAAAIAIENKTGKVLLWLASPDWSDFDHSGQIDGILVKNQMGSSMKPFLYAFALDKGIKPTESLPDIPMDFGEDKVYIPLNFNNRFNGPVILRNALASSLNVPAVYTLSKLGVENYYQLLLDLGFDSLMQGGLDADLGLALGAGEVSLKELTTAFSVFARDGKYIPLKYLDDEINEKEIDDNAKQIFSKDSSRIICSILSDKRARAAGFGFTQTFQTEYPSIFKTGTANQYQNIVALGSTADYTVGVWMGNHNGNTVMGKTGSSIPATIAREILDFLTNKKSPAFSEPENYSKIKVCTLSGLYASKDCPHTLQEYVKKIEIPSFCQKECNWHKKEKGKLITTYPAEYQKWLSTDFRNSRINHKSQGLKITTPRNNSHFFYDNKNDKFQQLTIEVVGGTTNTALQVFLDDSPLKNVVRPFIFTIPITRGKHHLKVQLGEESDEITFFIE